MWMNICLQIFFLLFSSMSMTYGTSLWLWNHDPREYKLWKSPRDCTWLGPPHPYHGWIFLCLLSIVATFERGLPCWMRPIKTNLSIRIWLFANMVKWKYTLFIIPSPIKWTSIYFIFQPNNKTIRWKIKIKD
jgi:hypothetical protein